MAFKLDLDRPVQLNDKSLDLRSGESGKLVLNGRFWDPNTNKAPDGISLQLG